MLNNLKFLQKNVLLFEICQAEKILESAFANSAVIINCKPMIVSSRWPSKSAASIHSIMLPIVRLQSLSTGSLLDKKEKIYQSLLNALNTRLTRSLGDCEVILPSSSQKSFIYAVVVSQSLSMKANDNFV